MSTILFRVLLRPSTVSCTRTVQYTCADQLMTGAHYMLRVSLGRGQEVGEVQGSARSTAEDPAADPETHLPPPQRV